MGTKCKTVKLLKVASKCKRNVSCALPTISGNTSLSTYLRNAYKNLNNFVLLCLRHSKLLQLTATFRNYLISMILLKLYS